MASKLKYPPMIDVSYWTIINWAALTPLPWVIVAKASEGDWRTSIGAFEDPRFRSHALNIKARGIRRSAYHFMRPGDIGNQANFFIKTIRSAGFNPSTFGDFVVLDWEDRGNTLADAKQFLEHVEREIGAKPIIYSSAAIVETLYGAVPPSWFYDYWWWPAGYPLPNADAFASIPRGYIPRGLTIENVCAWQYDEDGVIAGIQGNKNDLNWMNPLWMAAIRLTPPTGGNNMSYLYSIKPLFADGLKVRSGHEVTSVNVLSTLPYGKYGFGNQKWIAEADGVNVKKGDEWLEVLELDGRTFIGWVAGIHFGRAVGEITQIGEPNPIPVPIPVPGDQRASVTIDLAGYEPVTVTTTLKPKP